MGLFDKLKNKNKELTEEEKGDYVYDIYKSIDKRCNFKENLDLLSHCERTFYVALMLELDIYEGGFEEYFNSQSADYYHEVVTAFEELGSYEAAQICDRAIKALGEMPTDRKEREEYIEERLDDTADEILYDCELELKELGSDLTALYYDYIQTNISYFN